MESTLDGMASDCIPLDSFRAPSSSQLGPETDAWFQRGSDDSEAATESGCESDTEESSDSSADEEENTKQKTSDEEDDEGDDEDEDDEGETETSQTVTKSTNELAQSQSQRTITHEVNGFK